MSNITLQFHADPDELLHTLLPAWIKGHSLSIATERFTPIYHVELVNPALIPALPKGGVDQVALCRGPINTAVRSSMEFLKANPDCLWVTLGRLDDEGLRESVLGAFASDQDGLKTWRHIRRRATASLRKGAEVVNPVSGARGEVPNHYYSDGALALAKRGVSMLAFGGWNRYELDA
jgi:hypothetical protein